MLPTEATELAELQPLGRLLLVLRGAVVPALAVGALEDDVVAHGWPSLLDDLGNH